MSTYFFIQHSEKESYWKKYSWSFIWAALAIFKFFDWSSSAKKWDLFVGLIFALNAVVPLFYLKKTPKSYIKINNESVEWLLEGYRHPIILTFSEIKWIKFENEGVSLYQENSFCEFISFKGLEQKNIEELKNEFNKYGLVI
ncbi:MAG: hypothetical protein FD136_195 [Chitinophagaceae bacterium]|nr:MAG: hypothetical protein FD136_195 [Chitinophagaceae bacterium]